MSLKSAAGWAGSTRVRPTVTEPARPVASGPDVAGLCAIEARTACLDNPEHVCRLGECVCRGRWGRMHPVAGCFDFRVSARLLILFVLAILHNAHAIPNP